VHFGIALPSRLDDKSSHVGQVSSAAVNGIEAYPVEVEVNAGYGDKLILIVVNKTPNREEACRGASKSGLL